MDSSEEDSPQEEPTEQTKKRGRPVGVTDQKPRYRRTADQISQDKLRIAQMKLDALRESEERKLANKKPRSRKPVESSKVSESSLEVPPKKFQQDDTPSPKPVRSGRLGLYDSLFPPQPSGEKIIVALR